MWPHRSFQSTLVPANQKLKAWNTVTWREDTHSDLSGRFTALRVRPAHRDYLATEMRPEEWLLIEWPEGEDEPASYSQAPWDIVRIATGSVRG